MNKANIEENPDLKYIHYLYDTMIQNKLNYVYQGEFNSSITDKVLSFSEENLETTGTDTKVKKKVYFIMVECLQNITKHQNEIHDHEKDQQGIFMVRRIEDGYNIISGNLIENVNIDHLKSKLIQINNADKDGLKNLYMEILNDGVLSNKGGAGLGIIEMARKSGNKLAFDFEKLNEKLSYFYLQINILNDPERAITELDSINIAKDFHKEMIKKDILLAYEGEFTHEIIKSILSMAEVNIGESGVEVLLKKKVFNVMVEMLQNISLHSIEASTHAKTGKGLLCIRKENDSYVVTTGNIIADENIEELKAHLTKINNLSNQQLDELYNKIILSDRLISLEEKLSKKGAGLGLIDIALKCKRKLEFDFKRINHYSSFFTLQVNVSKP